MLWLYQIRSNFPELPSQKVEQLQGFKLIKKRTIVNTGSPVVGLAVILSSIEVMTYAKIMSPEDLNDFIISRYESIVLNSRHLAKPSESNWGLYADGQVSRSIGLCGSCPSTNPETFGFGPESLNWTIQDLISKFDLGSFFNYKR